MEYLNRMYIAVLVALTVVSCAKEKDVNVLQPERIRITAMLEARISTA